MPLLILVTYATAITLEVVTGGVTPPWPSVMAGVPTWVDALVIAGWALAWGVLEGRRRTGGVFVHAVGLASVAGLAGFQGSRVAVVNPVGAVIGSVIVAVLVVVAIAIAWTSGWAARAILRRNAGEASGRARAMLRVAPFVVLALRWLG
jgi:hypothetical protein